MKKIAILATMDTKDEEARYLKKLIIQNGCPALILDCSLRACGGREADVQVEELISKAGVTPEEFAACSKNGAITVMQNALKAKLTELFQEGELHGVISIGGVQGTVIATAAMQTLPVGVPKYMVSTVANGNATFGPFIGVSDMAIMHSVVDISGLNYVLRKVLAEAAGAICGMVKALRDEVPPGKVVGITMAGVTTPCVMCLTELLKERGYETLIFHCNGVGAHVMENLVDTGDVTAVFDISPHDITDGLNGGLMPHYSGRLRPQARLDVPTVFVPGGMDFILFNGVDKVPPEKKSRAFCEHNEIHTHVRASREEMEAAGRFVAERLAGMHNAAVVIPNRGFSQLNCPDGALYDPEADQGFGEAVKAGGLDVREVDAHINERVFAEYLLEVFLELVEPQEEAASAKRTY